MDNDAAKFQRDIIIRAIEECFQNFPLQNQHLIVDKIDIDLGVFTPDLFLQQGHERLTTRLREELLKIKVQHERHNESHNLADLKEQDQSSAVEPARKKSEQGWIIDSSKAEYLAFVNFLRVGRFPWWYQLDIQEKMADRFGMFWIQSLNNAEKSELKNTVTTSPQARIRIVNHFDTLWLEEFLQTIDLSGHEGSKQWKLFSMVALKFPVLRLKLHQNFWIGWIVSRRESRLCPDVTQLFEKTLQGQRQLVSDLLETLQNACLENIKNPELSGQSTFILKELANLFNIHEAHSGKQDGLMAVQDLKKYDKNITDHLSRKQLMDLVRLQTSVSTGDKKSERLAEEATALFIQGAGLVLLHPFLIELFASLNLWQDTTWNTEESSCHALKLLSYLSFGAPSVAEPQLVFLKLLAGLDIDKPIPALQPLTQKEISACDELLTAIIQHWKALRSTTPDGLREGFLQRTGKLTPVDNGHMLVVERKTQDVLLSHLPWGYSLIKLPWMEQMLHVSWI